LGFGVGVGLVAFEEEEIVGALFLGQVPAIGFGGVGRVTEHQDARQVHRRPRRGDGRRFVGVLRPGDLIDQARVGGLEVDERQGLFGLGLLLVGRGVQRGGRLGQGRLLRQARGRGEGVAQHFAVAVQDADGLGIQRGHPAGQPLAQLIGLDHREQPAQGPLARPVEPAARAGRGAAAQVAALAVVETLRKLRDRVRPLTAGGDRQRRRPDHAAQAMAHPMRVPRVGHVPAKERGQRTQLGALHRDRRGRAVAALPQRLRQPRRAQWPQRPPAQWIPPQLLGMFGVGVVILTSPGKPRRRPQGLPVGGPLTGAAKPPGIDERLDPTAQPPRRADALRSAIPPSVGPRSQ
jgi:hypothetical protein